MALLVKQNVDVLAVDVVEEVVWSKFLTPIIPVATKLSSQALVKPQTDVVAAICSAGALAHIAIEMDGAVAAHVALWYAIRVSSGIDVEASCISFEEALVFDRVAHDVDVELGQWEAFEADEYVEPLQ